MKKKLIVAVVTGLAAAAMFSSVAGAAPAPKNVQYANHFKTGTGDWTENGSDGTLNSSKRAVEAVGGSPYSYFGGTTSATSGHREIWPKHGYVASLDVYLDPAKMVPGNGFDLSVAGSTKTGANLRDFIFHVGMTASGELRVAGDNNSSFQVDDSVLAGGAQIQTAGWYTFQHRFKDNAGTLAVELKVINQHGATVFSTTRTTATDVISTVVGGPRYQWFTFINGTIRFDNQSLVVKY